MYIHLRNLAWDITCNHEQMEFPKLPRGMATLVKPGPAAARSLLVPAGPFVGLAASWQVVPFPFVGFCTAARPDKIQDLAWKSSSA